MNWQRSSLICSSSKAPLFYVKDKSFQKDALSSQMHCAPVLVRLLSGVCLKEEEEKKKKLHNKLFKTSRIFVCKYMFLNLIKLKHILPNETFFLFFLKQHSKSIKLLDDGVICLLKPQLWKPKGWLHLWVYMKHVFYFSLFVVRKEAVIEWLLLSFICISPLVITPAQWGIQ